MTPEEHATKLVATEDLIFDDGTGVKRWDISIVRQAFRDAIAAERERCAKEFEKGVGYLTYSAAAATVRRT